MKITIIVENYLPFIGGVETHARQIAHRYKELGHDVQILAANFAPTTLSPKLRVLHLTLLLPEHEDYDDDGVPVHAITPGFLDRVRMLPTALQVVPGLRRFAYHRLRVLGRSGYQQSFYKRIRGLVKGSDVVHSLAGGYLGWTAQRAAKSFNTPFVATPFVHPQQWGDGPEDIAYYKKSDAVIGLVDTDRDYLAEIGVPKDKLHVIGVSPDITSTVDPESFRKKYNFEGVPLVLYVGRMMPQKGAAALVAAASKIWEKMPDVHFAFVGPASPESEAWFAGNDDRLKYLGKVSAQDKADGLAACDVFCMPSMSEILPTVYLEAWSFGKPVVGGRAHGLPELVEGNGGGFAAAQDPDAVAKPLLELLQDPEKRAAMGKTGKELVEKKYSVAAVSQTLLDLYGAVIAAKRK